MYDLGTDRIRRCHPEKIQFLCGAPDLTPTIYNNYSTQNVSLDGNVLREKMYCSSKQI